jgi:hypothetical protein
MMLSLPKALPRMFGRSLLSRENGRLVTLSAAPEQTPEDRRNF